MEFLKPLVFSRAPVLVDSWVTVVTDDEVALAHEVYDAPADGDSDRTVYLRASTVLAHRLTDEERAIVDGCPGPRTSGDRSPGSSGLPAVPTTSPCGVPTSTSVVRRGPVHSSSTSRKPASAT